MRKLVIGMAMASTALTSPALAREGQWYIQGDGGVMIVEDQNLDVNGVSANAVANYDTGYDFGGMVGYDFGAFRLEAEASYRAADLQDVDKARDIAKKAGAKVLGFEGLGKLQVMIFEELVEHKLEQPHFITQYPFEVSPLARRNDDNPNVTDRFELFIGGREIANAYSELNDAEDQAERFMAQVADKDAGDDEAMHYDADFVRALEYGMPPTAGEGIGIDRLVMLLTNAPSIETAPSFSPDGSLLAVDQ